VPAAIKASGSPVDVLPSMVGFQEFLDLIGMPEIGELERRFCDGAD
jgi:hypothetical protein